MTAWIPPRPAVTRYVQISGRQADVLDNMCHGYTNRHIGSVLGVSEETAKSHVKALFRTLGARDRAHAVALAVSGQVHITVKRRYRMGDAA